MPSDSLYCKLLERSFRNIITRGGGLQLRVLSTSTSVQDKDTSVWNKYSLYLDRDLGTTTTKKGKAHEAAGAGSLKLCSGQQLALCGQLLTWRDMATWQRMCGQLTHSLATGRRVGPVDAMYGQLVQCGASWQRVWPPGHACGQLATCGTGRRLLCGQLVARSYHLVAVSALLAFTMWCETLWTKRHMINTTLGGHARRPSSGDWHSCVRLPLRASSFTEYS